MLKEIYNGILGRKKTLDEKIDYSEAIEILQGLEDSDLLNGVNIFGYDRSGVYVGKRLFPKHAVDNLEIYFKPKDLVYFSKGRHKVFSGGGKEKHYIYMEYGPMMHHDPDTGEYVMERTDRRITIDFLV